MAKEKVAEIKLQIPAGQANPAPPVGTALGPRGINIMAFCKEFNAATQKQAGDILPVVITVYKDMIGHSAVIFWSMLSFISILMVGYVYAVKKGALDFRK